MEYAIGVDIGGTKIRSAIVSEDGQLLADQATPTEPLFQPLREKAGTRTSPAMRNACSIIPATVGNDSGVIGAAAQVWHYTSKY